MAQIQGQLPFANASQAGAIGGSPGALAGAYGSAYNAALNFNQANYGNILKGYQQTAGEQANAFRGIQRGYARTTNAVMGQIQGVDRAAQQQITDQYAQQQGSSLQALMNAGLGNSTVTSSVARGLTADESKSRVNLANQMAQLRAGYTSQLGQAQLGFRANAANANTGLAQDQLHWMNSVNSPYPDAGMYAQLAQQYGLNQQMQRDRAALSPVGGGGAAPGLGYAPRAAPASYSGGPGEFGSPGAGNSIAGGASFFNPYSGSVGSTFGGGVNSAGYGGADSIWGAAGAAYGGAQGAYGSYADSQDKGIGDYEQGGEYRSGPAFAEVQPGYDMGGGGFWADLAAQMGYQG